MITYHEIRVALTGENRIGNMFSKNRKEVGRLQQQMAGYKNTIKTSNQAVQKYSKDIAGLSNLMAIQAGKGNISQKRMLDEIKSKQKLLASNKSLNVQAKKRASLFQPELTAGKANLSMVGAEGKAYQKLARDQAGSAALQNRDLAMGKAQVDLDNAKSMARGRLDAQFGKGNAERLNAAQVANLTTAQMKDMIVSDVKMEKGMGKTMLGVRKLTSGMRGFRMEMLGVMFFGMGMQKFFQGLLQPAMQAAGIFEIISTILQIVFLPVALAMLDPLLAIMDFFINLPEGAQLAIGVLATMGLALGTLLFVVGNLALGVGSLILVFGPLLAPLIGIISSVGLGTVASTLFAAALSVVGGILVSLAPIIAVIILIAAALYIAFQQNGAAITKALDSLFASFDKIFGGIMQVVEGVMEVIFGILELDADKAFGGLKKIAKGAIDFIIGFFWDLPVALFLVLAEVVRGILMWGAKLPGFLYDIGGKMIDGLIRGIGSMISGVGTALWNLIPEPFRSWLAVGAHVVGSVVSAPMNIGIGAANYLGGVLGFANGGIVTSPTMGLIGEAGPEAVIPLDQAGGLGMTVNPVYNINATINNDMDVRDLAEKLNEALTTDYRRLTSR